MDAIENFNIRLDSMDVCNTDMIKHYIKDLSKHVVRSPTKGREDGDVHSSSGYSPELGENGQKLKQKFVLQRTALDNEIEIDKEMKRLKNFGTISLSEDIAEGSKVEKKQLVKNLLFAPRHNQRGRTNA
ncbi:unnamed protein product [Trifolium pratense]|uniref:Uncharacterized protein n=1 Tax=Trifolium pratense TaxID=57577 RepID=A0ACB0IXI8_TRIPR|nr:unnamed protein product [Trifolium pratense]